MSPRCHTQCTGSQCNVLIQGQDMITMSLVRSLQLLCGVQNLEGQEGARRPVKRLLTIIQAGGRGFAPPNLPGDICQYLERFLAFSAGEVGVLTSSDLRRNDGDNGSGEMQLDLSCIWRQPVGRLHVISHSLGLSNEVDIGNAFQNECWGSVIRTEVPFLTGILHPLQADILKSVTENHLRPIQNACN